MRNVTEIQQFLEADLPGCLAPYGADGTLGFTTLNALNAYLLRHKRSAFSGVPTLTEINAALWPVEQPPAPTPQPTIFDQIGALVTISNLLKGKTVTQDQINGIIRLALGLIGGYFVSKGVVTQSLFDWISAGVLTAVPAVWSWYSNRPKTILPISQK